MTRNQEKGLTWAERCGIMVAFTERRSRNMSIYNAIVHKAEEGGYWAEVPELPGCVTEADTLDELNEMLKEAIAGYLEVAAENNVAIERTALMQVAV